MGDEASRENDEFDPEDLCGDDDDEEKDKSAYEPYEPYKDRAFEIRLQSVAEEEDEEEEEEEEDTMREIMGDTTEDALTPMDSPGLSDDLMVPAYHNNNHSHYSHSGMTTSGQSD